MLNAGYECSAKCFRVRRFSGILSLIIEIVVTLFLPFLLTFYSPAQYVRRLRTHGVGA